MGLLLRSPFAGTARKQLMVLSFTGRKTGRHYSIPLSAHLIDDQLYALTGAPWKQNFRDGGPVDVVYVGTTTAMRGELIRDRAVVSDLLVRAAESYGVARAQRMIGLKFRDHRMPTRDEFAEAVDRLHRGRSGSVRPANRVRRDDHRRWAHAGARRAGAGRIANAP